MKKQALSFGALLDPHTIVDVDFSEWPFKLVTDNNATIYALTVIIATGASQKKMGIENEGIYWGHGLFSCGICDASFTHGKDAIVIGGGDIAIQRALQIAPYAKNITFIVPGAGLTAMASMQKKIEGLKHISVLPYKQILKINGDNTTITNVELNDPRTNEKSIFKTQCIFLSTGLTPNTELFKDKLELDASGSIKLKEGRTQETLIPGVMAAGTVADARYRQVAVAVGDATKAALDTLKFLSQLGFDGPLKEVLKGRYYTPTPLAPIKTIQSIPEFEQIINHETQPVFIEFYSPECSHCKRMEAPVAALAKQFSPLLKIYKVNQTQFHKLTSLHHIQVIPAFIIFDRGVDIARFEGETSQEELFEFVEQTLGKIKKRMLCTPLESYFDDID